jgi:hypothetical protein
MGKWFVNRGLIKKNLADARSQFTGNRKGLFPDV